MRKKIAIIIVICLLICSGIFLYIRMSSNKKDVPKDTTDNNDNYNIIESIPGEDAIMYSWNIENISKSDFIDNLKQLNIKTLYQELPTKFLAAQNNEEIENLTKNNIKVFQLVGDPSWATKNEGTLKKEIDKVISYNENNDYDISGIVFDVEPYLNEEYDLNLYVDILVDAYNYAKSKNLYMVAAITYWYDKKDMNLLETLIKDGCDEVSVMNYNIKKTAENIENEVAFAKKYNKNINTIYEVKFGKENYFGSYEEINNDYAKLKEYNAYDKIDISYHHYKNMFE